METEEFDEIETDKISNMAISSIDGLPDYIQPNLKLWLIGDNPGITSGSKYRSIPIFHVTY